MPGSVLASVLGTSRATGEEGGAYTPPLGPRSSLLRGDPARVGLASGEVYRRDNGSRAAASTPFNGPRSMPCAGGSRRSPLGDGAGVGPFLRASG